MDTASTTAPKTMTTARRTISKATIDTRFPRRCSVTPESARTGAPWRVPGSKHIARHDSGRFGLADDGNHEFVPIIAGATVGLLIGGVLRVRSDLLAERLALPLLVAGGLLILSSRSPLEVVAALLVVAYTVTLSRTRVPRQ